MQRCRIVHHRAQESAPGIVGDAQCGGQDVNVHDDLGEQERSSGSVETVTACCHISTRNRESSGEGIQSGKTLMLVDRRDQRGARGPERVEDHHNQQQTYETRTGRHFASRPMVQERWAKQSYNNNDRHRDEERKLAGAAMQHTHEFHVARAKGDRELRPDGVVDHLHDLKGDTRDRARGAEDGDVDWTESIANGYERSLQVERVAQRKPHEGDGWTRETLDLTKRRVAPAVAYPRDVAADNDAHNERDRNVGQRQNLGCRARAIAEKDGYQLHGEGDQRQAGLEHVAVRVTCDAAIRRLLKLFKLTKKNSEPEPEEYPARVCVTDRRQMQQIGDRKEVKRHAHGNADDAENQRDEPPA